MQILGEEDLFGSIRLSLVLLFSISSLAMAERPKTPPLISPPAPEFTELIGIKRHKPSTELERHFDEGLRTGKKEDLYLMLERIKCLIETIDQSYQHHEIPVS